MSEKIKPVAIEVRFAIHVPSRNGLPDLHYVKEKVHWPDGTSSPRTRWVKDMKRNFWVTQPQYQTHKQKKEIEKLDRLMRYDCTQSELKDSIAKAIGKGFSNDSIKKLSNSPYLYGSEITSTAILKYHYTQKNTTHITPYTVMPFDIETDMLNGTEEPIIITAVMGNEILLTVVDGFLSKIQSPESRFRAKCQELLGEVVLPEYKVEVGGQKVPSVMRIGDYQITYIQCRDTIDLMRKTFAWIHERKPDFLAIWNMDFDIPKIIGTLERHGVNPADILCDPNVPRDARICRYREGLKKKRKSNGQEYPIDMADQWHTLHCTASFYVIDAMCTYRLLRLAKQKEPMNLDAILDKELGVRKLKFKEADAYVKERWHIKMQSDHKIEYLVYALFDSLSMKILDEKLLDLASTLPSYAGMTDFHRCNSKPKMIADALHYYALSKGVVLNSIGEQLEYNDKQIKALSEQIDEPPESEEDELNPDIMDLRGWVVTLPAHLVVPGLPLVAEYDKMMTKIRAFVYDSDCVSAYPTATSILNVSKSTTKREIIAIDGVDEDVFRLQNINLCSGYVNSLEYGNRMFGLPTLRELEDLID